MLCKDLLAVPARLRSVTGLAQSRLRNGSETSLKIDDLGESKLWYEADSNPFESFPKQRTSGKSNFLH